MKRFIVFLIMLLASFVRIQNVYALDVSINETKIFDKSDTLTIKNVSFDDLTITPSAEFNNIGDYVTLKVDFKGSGLNQYKILSVTDNNENEYVNITYKHDDTLKYPLYIIMTYANAANEKITLDNINITINLEKDGGGAAPIENPKTGIISRILMPLVLVAISGVLASHYLKYKNDTTLMFLLLCLIIAPFTVKAVEGNKLSLTLNASNMVVNGKKVEQIVEPETEQPEKETSKSSGEVPTTTVSPESPRGKTLWVAHQKNDADRVQAAIKAGFWGIEVDVYQSGSTFQLKHDTYHGYNLDVFLDTCKKNNIVAVLDLKSVSDYKKLIELVKSKGWFNYTIFQADTVSVVKSLNSADSNSRIWFLNSALEADLKVSEINSVKDKLEGINMIALSVDSNVVKQVHNMGLTICAFSYNSTMYDSRGKSANNLASWGTDYLMANDITKITVNQTNTIGSGSGGAGNCSGSYVGTKYSLTDAQKKKIAGMIMGEYSSDLNGMKAVASQMANLYEINTFNNATCTKGKTFYEYITLPVGSCGWYATYDSAPSTNANALKAVEDVLINGNRTLPLYIDEFDWYPNDILGASSISDSNSYTAGVTKLENKYGSKGTYYCITKASHDANIFFYTTKGENYRVAKGYAKGY